jgi:hypothetical protein
MSNWTIIAAGKRAAVALLLSCGLLLSAGAAVHADVAPAPTPRPTIEVPPSSEPEDCEWHFGWHLREDGPPIPYLELRCN